MSYIIIVVTVVFIILLYAGGKTLLHKRYYRDFIWYTCMLVWSYVIMFAYVQKWLIASHLTSVALFNECVEPISQLMSPIMRWGSE